MALAGGVALASAGFAIGSQSGDGSADARGGDRPARDRVIHFRAGPPGFGSLADRLGVSEQKLGEALEALRPKGDPGDELAAALAKSLGVEQAKVEAALTRLHARHERRHGVRHERSGPSGPGRRGHVMPAPHPGPGGPHGPAGPLGDELARELGVDAEELHDALAAFHDAKRDEFAEKLADRLGIDVDKVEEALPSRP